MIMVVFHHFALHGGFSWQASDVTIPHFWYNFILMGGKVGVNIFVLILGYFLINDGSGIFNFKRICKLWGQVFFYSIGIYIVFSAPGGCDFSVKDLVKSFFPITLSSWEFVSTYFVLYILHPFLNLFLKGLNKKSYQALLVMLVILWSVIPTITSTQYQGNSLLWFIMLYAISGYIRLHGFGRKLTAKHYFALWGIFSIATYASSVALTLVGTRWSIFPRMPHIFMSREGSLCY